LEELEDKVIEKKTECMKKTLENKEKERILEGIKNSFELRKKEVAALLELIKQKKRNNCGY